MPNYLDGVPADAGVYGVVDDRTGLYVVDPAKNSFQSDNSYLQPVGGSQWGLYKDNGDYRKGVNDTHKNQPKPKGKWGIKNDDDYMDSVEGYWGLQGPGSQPEALHTEYAESSADWGSAYHGDVVFYMIRADAGGGGGGGQSSFSLPDDDDSVGTFGLRMAPGSDNGGSEMGVEARSASNVQTGPLPPRGVQTSVSQVAVGSIVAQTRPLTATRKSLAGPMTGMDRDRVIPASAKSHAAVIRQTLSQSVQNITQVVESLSSDAVVKSFSASERFFYETLLSSYDPDITLGETRTEEEIRTTLERGPIADFSVNLAIASGGIRTTRNLIEAINLGEIGYTSDASTVQSERYGPKGKARRFSR